MQQSQQLRTRNDHLSQDDQGVSLGGIHRPPYLPLHETLTHIPHYGPIGTGFMSEEVYQYPGIQKDHVQYLLWLLAQPGRQQTALSVEAAMRKRENDLQLVNNGQELPIYTEGLSSLPVNISFRQTQLLLSLAPSFPVQENYALSYRDESSQLLDVLYTDYWNAFDQDSQIVKMSHKGKKLYYQYHDVACLSTAEATRPERVRQVFCEDIIGGMHEGGLSIIAPVLTPYYVPGDNEKKYTLIDGNNRTVSLLLYHYASHYHTTIFDNIDDQVKEFVDRGYMHAKWLDQLKNLLSYIAQYKKEERFAKIDSYFISLDPVRQMKIPCLMAYEEFFPTVNVALTNQHGKVILNPAHALSLMTESNTVFPPKGQSHGRISHNAAYKWKVMCL